MRNPPAARPQIGFDRFIPLDWAACGLRVRAGGESTERLEALMAAAEPGEASKKKSRSVLRGLWLNPHSDLVAFADRGVAIFKETDETAVPALCWGMAVTAYPFFGKVAELIGRLTSIQGDCTAAEIHRRMAETYGEREGTRRSTNRVVQSQASWGAVDRLDRGRRVVRRSPAIMASDALVAWLIEAALRYTGRPMPVATLGSAPVLYPFILDRSLPFVVSRSPSLDLRVEGSHSQVVAIR